MPAPDLFGILDAVKKLTAPAGMETVHQDGFSWARNGLTYGDSTKLTSDDWNRIIGNLRGLLVGSGVDLTTLDPASPMLLRDVLVAYVLAGLADVLPNYINDNAATIAGDIVDDPGFVAVVGAALGALTFNFATATADADPGAGLFRLNNASPASATAAYIDNADAFGSAVAAILDTWDDSTNTIRGTLTVRPVAAPAVQYTFNVTGAVVDGTGYRKLTLAYVSGSGAIAAGAACWLVFNRAGNKGADGIGDFSGPASSVTDNIMTFAGTTGKVGKDSGVAMSSLAPKASPTFTGTPAGPTAAPGTNTTQLATTGFVKAAIDVVLGGVSVAFDTLSEIAAAMLQKATDNTGITAGFTAAAAADGTKSSGTYTPSPAGGNFKTITNGGAFTLAAPSLAGTYNMEIDITNNASAGAITFTGFVSGYPKGDPLTTTNANSFKLHISKTAAGVTAVIEALQ